jgi:hypothetical protein
MQFLLCATCGRYIPMGTMAGHICRRLNQKRTITLETPEGANQVAVVLDGDDWRLAICDEAGKTVGPTGPNKVGRR